MSDKPELQTEISAKHGLSSTAGAVLERLVIRKAFICVHCESVYADEPVGQCDCLGGTGADFTEGEIKYSAV